MRGTLLATAVLLLPAGPAVALELSGPEVVRVGDPATFVLTGGAPGVALTLDASPNASAPGNCCGRVLGTVIADSAGAASLTVTWPATYVFCGGVNNCSAYPWRGERATIVASASAGDGVDVSNLVEVDVDPAAGGVARPSGLTPHGREPVGLGASVSRLFGRWGRVDGYADPGNNGVAGYPFGVEATVKLTGARRVTEFTIFDGDWATTKGVKLGTPRTDLIRAYGKGLHRVRYHGRKFQTRFHYYVRSGPHVLAFVMSRGRVVWMVSRPNAGVTAFLTDQVGPV